MKVKFPDNQWGKKTGIKSKHTQLTLPEETIPVLTEIAKGNGYKTLAEFIKACIKSELTSLGHTVEA